MGFLNSLLVSLGSSRRMLIRAKGGDRDTLAIDLASGSLLCMSHASQLTHEHGIPKTRREQPARISVAFRVRTASEPHGAGLIPYPDG